MKKIFLTFLVFLIVNIVFASDMFYSTKPKETVKTYQTPEGEKREIRNLAEYFRYLPKEVHRNWIPYRAESNYEVTVQFKIYRDGKVSDIKIVESNNIKANTSVIQAVKNASPYQPLPKSYPANSVSAQVILQYQN